MTDPMTDPVARFEQMTAEHERCFWLDGGRARPWSGRSSILGWLDDNDTSLLHDATPRTVTRHRDGASEVAGRDIFAVPQAASAGAAETIHWGAYIGYARRSDLTAHTPPN